MAREHIAEPVDGSFSSGGSLVELERLVAELTVRRRGSSEDAGVAQRGTAQGQAAA